MLGINISVLTLAELRRLLTAAESRGQEALAAQLREELASRQAGRERAAPAEPAAFEAAAWEPAPIRLQDPDDIRLERARPSRPRRRLWPWSLAAAAVAAGGLAWGLVGAPALDLPRPASVATAKPGVPQPAAPASATAPRAMSALAEPAAVAPPPPSSEPPPLLAPEPKAEPAPQRLARAAPEPPRPARLDPCARAATPADRLVCSDLALDFLDRRMQAAYSRALAAADDPGALAADQAAWRAERGPVSDPQALARLYDQRTRELEAAVQP